MENRWEDFWKSGRVEDYLGYCGKMGIGFENRQVSDVFGTEDGFENGGLQGRLEKNGRVETGQRPVGFEEDDFVGQKVQ